MRSELITDRHLARCAVIYVRQSSPHQVLTNQESLRLQYDLRQRALGLGWRDEDVAVIDADLGLSGAAATHREGFKELIARVTLGQVGVVLSSEVTRLTRNCSDWFYGRSRSVRTTLAARAAQKKLPCEQWRVVVRDKYPAYISWEIFEKIQAMLQDNYAEYSRNKTRGVPREGATLLHGIIYCGACGHKMVVQYKSGSRYICNYFRQQSGVPVCQYIQTNPVDTEAGAAFFKALAPAELDVFAQAVAVRHAAEEAALKAQAQQVERLRYRAALTERQFGQVD